MSAERVVYLDSSAIVKLVVREPESKALRSHLRRKQPLVSSALARTEVLRAVLPFGQVAVERGGAILRGIELARINDRILAAAGVLLPPELRSLDAIHLATALEFDDDLRHLVTYDDRMATAAEAVGIKVLMPA